MDLNLENYVDDIRQLIVKHGMSIIIAIIVLLIGLRIIKVVTRGIDRLMQNRGVDDSLRPFLTSVFNILFKVMLFITVIQMIGIETTSFIAVLASAGLAVGLALSGTLQNFAGGVILLLLKPFKKGDFIEAQGYMGTVNAMQIFTTVLKTVDNKTIFIPNGPLSTGTMVNFSAEENRRVDMVFGVSYTTNVDEVKAALEEIVAADDRIHKEPAHMIVLSSLGDSSVNYTVRVWTKTSDYWGVFFDFHEKVKRTFDAKGIGIPYPQMDVHLFKKN